jgi:hypothetical protein
MELDYPEAATAYRHAVEIDANFVTAGLNYGNAVQQDG